MEWQEGKHLSEKEHNELLGQQKTKEKDPLVLGTALVFDDPSWLVVNEEDINFGDDVTVSIVYRNCDGHQIEIKKVKN